MAERSEQSAVIDRMIDVGGHRLHFRIFPGTEPTVLLGAGGGADSNDWESLPTDLACETGGAIVAYDRAGYGESDLPDTPYDIRAEIAGLWRGLEELGLSNTLIAVGHSYGGLLIQVLAGEHSTTVRGLVFVDPMNVEFIDALGGVAGLTSHPLAQHPFDASRVEALTKPQRAALRVEAGLPNAVAIVRTMPVAHDIPIRVLTAGKPWWPKADENQAWRKSHEHLAASVKNGKLLVAENSAHLIPYEQPEILVAAVKELVRDARAWPPREPDDKADDFR